MVRSLDARGTSRREVPHAQKLAKTGLVMSPCPDCRVE